NTNTSRSPAGTTMRAAVPSTSLGMSPPAERGRNDKLAQSRSIVAIWSGGMGSVALENKDICANVHSSAYQRVLLTRQEVAMRFASILISGLLGAGLMGGPAWAVANDPYGIWIDDKGRGGVEIKNCGANLCGHVVWAKDEADNGKGCGKQIIGD